MTVSSEIGEALQESTRLFEKLGIQYAIGGAVAMAFGGYPRATRDIDVLILLPALRSQELADAMNATGFHMRDEMEHEVPVEVPRMLASSREFGHFRIWWKQVKIEVFTPRVPIQDSALKRRSKVAYGSESLWITTVEDLILLKMIFHRSKDIEDVRRLIESNRSSLDFGYLESWIPKTLPDAVGAELLEMLKPAGR